MFKNLIRVTLAAIVLGVFASYLISTDKWGPSVIEPVNAVLGEQAGTALDQGVRNGLAEGDQMVDRAKTLTATELLSELLHIPSSKAERTPKYDRDEFGNGWQSDLNGCSTREIVLMRDLTNVTMRDDRKCKVATGTLADPYTGKTLTFSSITDPQAVQIDHVVPLSVAWKMGAWKWSPNERVAFSNDTENLLAVDGPTNSSKGDKTPDAWMPKNTATQCSYAETYTYVTAKYQLSLGDATKRKLSEVLEQC